MARYSNPQIRQKTFKDSTHNEHRDTLKLVFGIIAVLVATLLIADRLCYYFAPRLPFSWEVKLADNLGLSEKSFALMGSNNGKKPNPQDVATRDALQARVEVLRKTLAFPDDMPIVVHYIKSDTVNAAATLGGHVAVFQGLIARVQSQEELDAVLAHELGHVRHRHMARQMSRGIMIGTVLSFMGMNSSGVFQWLLGDVQNFELLARSREAEREADEDAIFASKQLYGHTGGMVDLFDSFAALERERGGGAIQISWLRSHPLSEDRSAHAKAQLGSGVRPAKTPLDPALQAAAKDLSPDSKKQDAQS